MTEPRWSCVWEDDLPADAHRELAALLRRGFPRSRAGFPDATSWASARPELRLVGYRDDRPVAHLGILRRFVQVGSGSLLIGDVGLVLAAFFIFRELGTFDFPSVFQAAPTEFHTNEGVVVAICLLILVGAFAKSA